MNSEAAATTYREQAFESAPPIKIVRMLYQGALRFLDRALACDPGEPSSDFARWIGRADAIVSELRASLEPECAPELSLHLRDLYLFVEGELQRALAQRDVEPLRNAREVLAMLAEAWSRVDVRPEGGEER